jgi:hypothetical protein
MADVMLDSSAWIEYFRRAEGAVGDTILRLLDEDRVTLCRPEYDLDGSSLEQEAPA